MTTEVVKNDSRKMLHTNLMLFLKNLLAIVAAFLIPIKGIMLTVGLMIAVDTVIGIYRSKKLGIKITSRKLSNLVSKMVLYQSAIVLFFMIEKYMLVDILLMFTSMEFLVTKLVALTLISIELKSIDENYKSISKVSLFSKFKEMLKRAKEVKDDLKDLNKD